MRNAKRALGCLAFGLLLAVVAGGQDAGSIVGWGLDVVVPQGALTDLVAVAAGGYHGLGLKADGSIAASG
jgi:hypothetical protein